jgi:hypothetical protein
MLGASFVAEALNAEFRLLDKDGHLPDVGDASQCATFAPSVIVVAIQNDDNISIFRMDRD